MSELDYTAQHLYHRFLGRNGTDKEIEDLVTYGLGYGGYYWPDARLRSQPSDVPMLWIYSSCHAEQILTYLKDYRPDVMDRFSVNAAFTHRLLLHRGHFNLDLLQAIFGHSDKLLCNLMSAKFEELSTTALLPSMKPFGQVVSFVPPSFSAFFPVTKYYGEEPVARGLLDGKTVGQLIREFHEGTFDCLFQDRYVRQIDRLKAREGDHDIGLTELIGNHHKTHKMFFCDNHPTFHVITHITDAALIRFGLKGHDDPEHALKVPVNGGNFSNHFPETDYERKFYGFTYPKQFTEDWGGASAFYPGVIEDIAKRMTDPKTALEGFTPVELEK